MTETTSPAPLLPGTAWTRGGLTIIDPALGKKLRRRELSPSMSFALDGCGASMAADRMMLREDLAFGANSLGTAAHAVLETLFNGEPHTRTREAVAATTRRLLDDSDFRLAMLGDELAGNVAALEGEERDRWYDEVHSRAIGIFDVEDPTAVEVYANELAIGGWNWAEKKPNELKADIAGVPFSGKVDRVEVVRDESGEIAGLIVSDYKFGAYKEPNPRFGDDYGDQVRDYRVVVEAVTGLPVVEGKLIYPAAGKVRPIDLSETEVKRASRRFKNAAAIMHRYADNNLFEVTVGPLCGWCTLVNSCPAAKAAGKVDMTDTVRVNGRRVPDPNLTKTAPSAVALGIPTVKKPALALPSFTSQPKPAKPKPPAKAKTGKAKRGDHEATVAIAQREAELAEVEAQRAAVHAQAAKDAAHIQVEHTADQESNMSKLMESKPWEKTAGGMLNPNSYAATAVFWVVQYAAELVAAAGYEPTKKNVRALASTRAQVVISNQRELTGETGWEDGANHRMRDSLRSAIRVYPLPFGQPAEAWEEWIDDATSLIETITDTALGLFKAKKFRAEAYAPLTEPLTK